MPKAERIPLRARDGSIRAYVLVDAADYEAISRYRWHIVNGRLPRPRVSRYEGTSPGRKRLQLSRELLGLPPGRYPEVDHVNGDTLDCRRANLRAVTKAQNQQNRQGADRDSRSGVRGVTWDKRTGRWAAGAMLNGKRYNLGRYDSIEEAETVVGAWRREHMPFSEMDRACH